LQPEDHQGHRNLRHQKQESQAPVDQQHGDGDHRERDQVSEHTDSSAGEDLSKSIHIAGETRQQLSHRHAVVIPEGKIQSMGEQVPADPGRESLTQVLIVGELNPLKGETQQHRDQQCSDDQSEGEAAVERLEKGHHCFVGGTGHGAKNRDGLTDEQRLDGNGQRQGNQQRQGQQQSTTVLPEIAAQTADAFQVRTGHQAALTEVDLGASMAVMIC